MKIINGKELAFMPNGTVFSDITDENFSPDGTNGDMTINGINIMCGHGDTYCTLESGTFNGVLHMLNWLPCTGTHVETYNDKDNVDEDYWDAIYDTDSNDYTENDWVVVYEREEIKKIIENLQWALKGCPNE